MYVLVVNLAKFEALRVDYWLRLIKLMSQPYVIIEQQLNLKPKDDQYLQIHVLLSIGYD